MFDHGIHRSQFLDPRLYGNSGPITTELSRRFSRTRRIFRRDSEILLYASRRRIRRRGLSRVHHRSQES